MSTELILALSWYFQSYLIGIKQFVVGLHEDCEFYH
jgi:hypothetical protein